MLLSTEAVVADVSATAKGTGNPDSHRGSRSLGVSVSAEGEALENVPVTVVDKNTNR
ncbi:hypothetical protein [Haladaptatus halobius]|uniref:hypothetical protein n=1 Tax=Haladaptatus halobius TaxID=2884875 RepID=UPI001D09BBD5|nr:hypothetical protein [Haladaptatus halobius]